jgi:hypothetical protein
MMPIRIVCTLMGCLFGSLIEFSDGADGLAAESLLYFDSFDSDMTGVL